MGFFRRGGLGGLTVYRFSFGGQIELGPVLGGTKVLLRGYGGHLVWDFHLGA